MRKRNKSRLILILSAIPIVPISVILLIVTMLSWDAASFFPQEIWTVVLLHPFLSCLCLMIAMSIHKQALYILSVAIGVLPQIGSFLLFWGLYFDWVFGS